MSFNAIEATDSPASGNGFYSFCSSDDFQIIAFAHAAGIHMSYDYGSKFNNNSVAGTWRDVCCSSDGKYIYGAAQGSDIWRSNNYGITFTATGQPGTKQWYGCCCSKDGRLVYAVVNAGQIWWSNDYGASFNALNTSTISITDGSSVTTAMPWRQICCNDYGTKLFVSTRYNDSNVNTGYIYQIDVTTTNNYNYANTTFTWYNLSLTAKQAADNTINTEYRYWRGIRCNSTGTKVVATIDWAGGAAANHGIYIFTYNSSNTTTPWTFTNALNDVAPTIDTPVPSDYNSNSTTGIYICIGLSRDGKNMITGDYATANNQKCYYSIDYGITWTMVDLGSRKWHAAYVCNNKFIIGSDDANKCYIGQFYPDPSFFTIGGASFGEIISPAMTHGDNTGRVMTLIQDGVLPYYSWAFNRSSSTDWLTPVSNGMDTSTDWSIGGSTAKIIYSYSNPAGLLSYDYNNKYTSGTSYIFFNNTLSYSSSSTVTQGYIQSGVDYLKSFSISFWILPAIANKSNTTQSSYISLLNFSNSSSVGCIDIGIYSVPNTNYGLAVFALNNDYDTGSITGTSGACCTNNVNIVKDYWYHITATYDSPTGYMYLYVNYNNSRSNTTSKVSGFSRKDLTPGAEPNIYNCLIAGMRYGNNNYTPSSTGHIGYYGLMGNLNIYPRALTEGEVQKLYESERNVYSSTTPNTTTSLTLNNYFNHNSSTTNLYNPVYSFSFTTTNATESYTSIGTNTTILLQKDTVNNPYTVTDISYSYTNSTYSTGFDNNSSNQLARKFLSINNGASYTGTKTSQAYLKSSANLTYNQTFSISFWIYPWNVASSGNYINLLNFTDSSNNTGCIDVAIDGSTSKVVFVLNNDYTNNKAISDITLSSAKWYHIVVTHNYSTGLSNITVSYNNSTDGTVNKVSANGTKQYSSNTGPNNYTTLVAGLRKNYNTGPANGFVGYNGFFSNINIYSSVLTSNEIDILYNAGLDGVGLNFNDVSLRTIYNYNNSTSFPLIKGQGWFGDSPFSKVQLYNYYNLTNNSISMNQESYTGMFSPFYTVYTTTGDSTHTLQSWTKFVFLICIGGGGGGSCGNYDSGSGSSGGAGGGGGGGGLAWGFFKIPNGTNTLTVTVGAGGSGGLNNTPGNGSYWWLGGNGTNGTDSKVVTNSIELCNGKGGQRSFHRGNPNTGTNRDGYSIGATNKTAASNTPYSDDSGGYSSTSTNPYASDTINVGNNIGAVGGLGGGYSVTTNDNYVVNSVFCGGYVGQNGNPGQNDPESGSSHSTPGSGGVNGIENTGSSAVTTKPTRSYVAASPGLIINGTYNTITYSNSNYNNLIIWNWDGTKFINRQDGSLICTGSGIRSIYGNGSDGSRGEGRAGGGVSAAGNASSGIVLIFEYAVSPV